MRGMTARSFVLAFIVAAGAAAGAAAPADAYTHRVTCDNYYSGQQCYDAGYHPWLQIAVYLNNYKPEVCARAATQSGNVRTGSVCAYRGGQDVLDATACLAGSRPESNAYGFWTARGRPSATAPRNITVVADTPNSAKACNPQGGNFVWSDTHPLDPVGVILDSPITVGE